MTLSLYVSKIAKEKSESERMQSDSHTVPKYCSLNLSIKTKPFLAGEVVADYVCFFAYCVQYILYLTHPVRKAIQISAI